MQWPLVRSLNVPLAIFVLVLALLGTGLVSVYSASASLAGFEQRRALSSSISYDENPSYHATTYLVKQMIFAAAGLMVLAFFATFDYRRLQRFSFWIMAGCFLACCAVWIPGIGHSANGARRWLSLGGYVVQPSEFAKLGLIIYMAKLLDDRHRQIKSFFSGVFPGMVIAGAFAAVIVLEPDFGSAFVLCLIVFGMWLCGEVRWFHLSGIALAAVPAAVMAFILQPYRIKRVLAFIFPSADGAETAGYQLRQSLIAVGSGGPWGLGLGHSVQKYHYLFAGHTDFIFAIVAEEMGFWRTSVLILMFAALVILGWHVAMITSDLFGSLLATGITLMLFLGASINMAVVLGLLPTKGLTLPLISAGGSSLIVTLASMGILINIAQRQFALLEPAVPRPRHRR